MRVRVGPRMTGGLPEAARRGSPYHGEPGKRRLALDARRHIRQCLLTSLRLACLPESDEKEGDERGEDDHAGRSEEDVSQHKS
jgi:hypothetical protein